VEKPKLGVWLWVLAFVVMVVAVVYQRRLGPTYPLKGNAQIAGQRLDYSLPRSAENTGDARVVIPDPGQQARVLWRRYPSHDPFTVVIMAPEEIGGKKILTANIPPQEAAGKIEYKLEIGNESLPNTGTVIMRFKGAVSPTVLLLHIVLMFAAMLTSTRAGLGAVFGATEKVLPWVTLGLVLVGGIFFGALVAKAAFGTYWGGWPYGWDMTDNKTLLMFLAWLAACLLLPVAEARRMALVAAAALTIVVYLIPHSLEESAPSQQQDAVEAPHGENNGAEAVAQQ